MRVVVEIPSLSFRMRILDFLVTEKYLLINCLQQILFQVFTDTKILKYLK